MSRLNRLPQLRSLARQRFHAQLCGTHLHLSYQIARRLKIGVGKRRPGAVQQPLDFAGPVSPSRGKKRIDQ